MWGIWDCNSFPPPDSPKNTNVPTDNEWTKKRQQKEGQTFLWTRMSPTAPVGITEGTKTHHLLLEGGIQEGQHWASLTDSVLWWESWRVGGVISLPTDLQRVQERGTNCIKILLGCKCTHFILFVYIHAYVHIERVLWSVWSIDSLTGI